MQGKRTDSSFGSPTKHRGRQIISFDLDGDFLDLEWHLPNTSDQNVKTLTRCEITLIHEVRCDFRCIILRSEWRVGRSTHRRFGYIANGSSTSSNAMVSRASLIRFANLGGGLRLRASQARARLAMKQEQLADATGMLLVHFNRVLKRLGSDEPSSASGSSCTFPTERLRNVAGFSELYLHLDQVVRGRRPDRSL